MPIYPGLMLLTKILFNQSFEPVELLAKLNLRCKFSSLVQNPKS